MILVDWNSLRLLKVMADMHIRSVDSRWVYKAKNEGGTVVSSNTGGESWECARGKNNSE